MLLHLLTLSSLFYLATAFCNYTNPLLPFTAPDPWVTYHNGSYYWSLARHGGIEIYKSNRLSDWTKRQQSVVWKPPKNTMYSHEIWAPELHRLDNKWYIYFTADNCTGCSGFHRMFVLEANTDNALGNYTFRGQLDTLYHAIDGTVFTYKEQRYFSWSGRNPDRPQRLFIAKMVSPTKITGRVLLASPKYAWEKRGFPPGQNPGGLVEAPQQLINPRTKQHFLTYSGSPAWSRYYAIGILELIGNDPMNVSHWKRYPEPFFKESDKNKVYGVGHASFVKSKDGSEDYIVYHGMDKPDGGFNGRTARVQKFGWDNKTGLPVFGAPVPMKKVLPAPRGECW